MFYSKIALWPISYVAKMFASKVFTVKMSVAKMLTVKVLDSDEYMRNAIQVCRVVKTMTRKE